MTPQPKRISLALGAAAVVALGALSVGTGGPVVEVAKDSGASATGTAYVQPSVGAATLGATATAATTPSSMPATTKAVPPLKAS